MARKIKLTDARIGKLKAGDVEYMVWDTRIAGFGIRVRPSGHKSYVYHRHAEGQSRKFTLGPVALGSVDEARRDCMEVWGRMQSGERVEGADGAQAPLFRDFVAGSWRAACYEPCKQSTKTSKDWALNNQLVPVFGARPLDRIDRTGVVRWFEGYSVTAPGGANSALLVLRQIMNHAVTRGHIETNPTRGVKRNPRPKLTRFLSREEIGRLHEVLDHYEARWPPWTKQVWYYDYRTNIHHTLKKKPMRFEDLSDFVRCYNPRDRHQRKATWSQEGTLDGRWRSYSYEEIRARDKTSLDIFWLRDKSLTDLDNLPEPDDLAEEIIENLEAGLNSFREVLSGLRHSG